MSTYKRPGARFYIYDFRWHGRRYTRLTGATTKREADRIEAEVRESLVKAEKNGATKNGLTVARAISDYWLEVGSHHVADTTTLRDLAWLERHLGKSKPLSAITDRDVASLIATRRSEGVAPATVNRSLTARLRAVITRAEKIWRVAVPSIRWTMHMLPEPQERIRELSSDEESRLFDALAPGYHSLARFSLLSGCRMQECLDLEWRHIDWHSGYIVVKGKGEKTRHIPLTGSLRQLLWPLPRAAARVFTLTIRRGSVRHARGATVEIEREALKIHFRRTTARLDMKDFRFHDLRHTCATRLLRATGNLRLVRDLLGHSDITTTMKYAHASQTDLMTGLDAAFPAESPAQSPAPLSVDDKKALK